MDICVFCLAKFFWTLTFLKHVDFPCWTQVNSLLQRGEQQPRMGPPVVLFSSWISKSTSAVGIGDMSTSIQMGDYPSRLVRKQFCPLTAVTHNHVELPGLDANGTAPASIPQVSGLTGFEVAGWLFQAGFGLCGVDLLG